MAFRGPRVALLHLPCFLSWPLRCIPWPPRGLASPTLLPVVVPAWHSVAPAWPCFTYFAFCHGPCVALIHLLCFLLWPLPAWPSVALLHLPCFLSWPLRGIPWPPRGLASSTLLPVMARAWPSVAPAWPCFTYLASCHGPCPRVALLHLLCFLSWRLRGIPWPPRGLASPTLLPVMAPALHSVAPAWPCFTYFASCHGACVAFRGPRVALLHLLCFLSWPLRGLDSPTLLPVMAPPCVAFRGLASPTLLPVMAPAWHSVAPAWPCFIHFASCYGPCVAFRGPRVALLHLPCFLSWPLRGLPWPPRGLALPTLLPVMAPAWPSVAPAWPCFTYLASCHGPCVAFRGRRVALLHLPCFLSWPLRGIPWPPRGLASPTLLPVAWPSVAPAWPCFAYLASCRGPCVAFRGPRMALLHLLSPAWPCFTHFASCHDPSKPGRLIPIIARIRKSGTSEYCNSCNYWN